MPIVYTKKVADKEKEKNMNSVFLPHSLRRLTLYGM